MSSMQSDAVERLKIRSEHTIRAENLPFDIDVWYPPLAEFTFRTIFRPLKVQEAVALMNYYKGRFMEKKGFTAQDKKVLDSLERDLDKAIKDNFAETGAFMRLCGRSQKDAEPLDRRTVWDKYQVELKKLLKEGEDPSEADAITILQAMARVTWLRVTSGREAMSLLLTSERVFADMHDWVNYGEPEQIVLREWEPQLRVDYEFRCFVYQNQLTAISQYDHYGYYPYLEDKRELIKTQIIELWQRIHSHVGEDTYVFDVGHLLQDQRTVLVELSPYLSVTGPALFHWTNDWAILSNSALGQQPNWPECLPFRLQQREKLHPHLAELLEENWTNRWKPSNPPSQFETPYWEFYEGLIKATAGLSKQTVTNASSSSSSSVWTGLLNSFKEMFTQPDKTSEQSKDEGEDEEEEEREQLKRIEDYPLRLFVYGTLKSGFHWNTKFLSHEALLVGPAETVNPYPLVVGESGVPYLLGDLPEGQGFRIKGEVWAVNEELLKGMDEYEGVNKGYYSRSTIQAQVHNADGQTELVTAFVYMKAHSTEELAQRPFLAEYTLEYHKQHYKPIRHIQVKQQMYLGVEFNRT